MAAHAVSTAHVHLLRSQTPRLTPLNSITSSRAFLATRSARLIVRAGAASESHPPSGGASDSNRIPSDAAHDAAGPSSLQNANAQSAEEADRSEATSATASDLWGASDRLSQFLAEANSEMRRAGAGGAAAAATDPVIWAGGGDASSAASNESAWIGSAVSFAEEDDSGRKYLEVLVTSVHQVDHGMVVGLLCTPANRGPPVDASREFPLFLNALTAGPVQEAMQRGGLPHALEALPRLRDLDLQRTLVDALEERAGAATFVVVDESTGEVQRVGSTFPQAMALALRYRQPILVERRCILTANRDFIERMLLNPKAREVASDASLLADLASRMRRVEGAAEAMRVEMEAAVAREEYELASSLQAQLREEERAADARLFSLLSELRRLYLDRMGVFFKL